MKKCLIDAGPLIALFDRDDKYHISIKSFLRTYDGHLYTTWPVITEVLHILDFNINAQIDFLKWLKRGALEIKDINIDIISRIIALSEKYSDVSLDFAYASLIIISEQENIKEILSIPSE
jgi:predicted nucleic acid-binding protein